MMKLSERLEYAVGDVEFNQFLTLPSGMVFSPNFAWVPAVSLHICKINI